MADSILDKMDQDEVIADSEGEGEMEMDPFEQAAGKNFISSVSGFTTTAAKDTPNRTVSSISECTAGPSRRKLDVISPAFALDKQTHEQSTMEGQEDTSFEGALSIADRAKTRQRTQTKRKADADPLDVIELTSDDEDDDLPKPPPKSKAKTRPKARLKTKNTNEDSGRTKASPQPHHETTTNTKEPQRPRPRPRPRPIRKPDGSNPLPPHPYPFGRQPQHPFLQEPPVPHAPPTPPPQSSPTRGDDIPIATSPPRLAFSQLPPSDPPQPSAYRQEEPARIALPPIEVLKDAGSDRRESSPSSLLEEKASSTSRRKKRIPADEQDHMEVDQLQSSPLSGAYMPPPKLVFPPKRNASPPPTFFAAFSSSAGIQDRQDPPEVPIPAQDVVDLTDLPPTIAPVKPKKSKAKKKTVDEDLYLDGAQPMRVLDEDDNDGDFDPTGDGSGKGKKTKAKSKAKAKKPKENKKVVVEVVVPAKPKGKGKEKQAKEADVFKSREFIEESDEDDADPLRLVGNGEASAKVVDDSSTVYVKPRSSVPQTGSPSVDAGPSGSAGSSKSSKTRSAEEDRAKTKPKTKKRKSIVEPDADVEDVEESIKVKKPRKSNKKVLPDDEPASHSEHEHQSTAKTKDNPKTRRQSKVITSDGEDEPAADMPVETEEPVEKENKSPPKLPQKVISTPRPIGRAPSVFPDGSTPLYTRYEVAPRRGSLPMSELIRRASTKPASPFPASTPNVKDKGKSKASRSDSDAVGSPAPSTPMSTYSPFLKSSRRLLSRIAPLHPNRRTPPPPPPPPPPKKKTKKELELEEKWEEELIEDVGGLEAFAAMDEVERKALRRAKRDREMYGFED